MTEGAKWHSIRTVNRTLCAKPPIASLVMEEVSSLPVSSTTILFTIFALSISLCYLKRLVTEKQAGGVRKTAPQAGGSWPLLGHLHLLGGPTPTHLVLAQMADSYGPIFSIRLGPRRAVVVSTRDIAKECLTTNDRVFATRPESVSTEVMTYNYALLGLSPYGPYWRQIRKFVTLELFSNHRIGLLKEVRESEVLASVRDLHEEYQRKNISSAGALNTRQATWLQVDMNGWFWDIIMNIMLRVVVGRRVFDQGEDSERRMKAMRDYVELLGKPVVADALPFLRRLDLGGHEKAMKTAAKKLDEVMQGWLDEHKAKRDLNRKAGRTSTEHDLMDVMLSSLENTEIHAYDSDTVNKATCLSMIVAGTDTTMVSMTWALSLLLNNKEALKKAQQELDDRIGRGRQVNESDLKNLPYLQAVIKETFRLYPPLPLAVPHEAIEDCTISGYFIPKGTQLFLNLHKIHRDPQVWPSPSEFRPERFLTSKEEIDVRGQNLELIPFGSGRRMCPGISMALQVMGLTLASFLHAFDVRLQGDEAVDMEETFGLSNLKATPLEVLVTPRVTENVY